MPRGGRAKQREGPERRCVVTGVSEPAEGLIRFALSPEGAATPDLAGKLPGRGVWVSSRRDAVEKAAAKNLFSRGFRRQVAPPDPDVADMLEAGLTRRLIDAIALARKAGLAIQGFEKVRARLRRGPVAVLIEARDGAEGGRAKLRPLAQNAVLVDLLSCAELGLAFGRDFVIHASLDPGGASARVVREQRRLSGFRPSGVAQARAARAAISPGAGAEDDGR